MYVVCDDSGSLFHELFQHFAIIYVEEDVGFMCPSANMANFGYTTVSFHVELLKLMILFNFKILIAL